jgi:hypothetical protein
MNGRDIQKVRTDILTLRCDYRSKGAGVKDIGTLKGLLQRGEWMGDTMSIFIYQKKKNRRDIQYKQTAR